MHICTVTVALHINILLISHFTPFFSLFSIYKTNSSIFSPSSSSSSSHTHKHTHTHGQTNRPNIAKSTQTHHPHRPNTTKSNTPQNQPRTHHKINHRHTTKSTKNQTRLHANTPTETKGAFLWAYGCGLVFGGDRNVWFDWKKSLWISACGESVLVDWCLWINEFQP